MTSDASFFMLDTPRKGGGGDSDNPNNATSDEEETNKSQEETTAELLQEESEKDRHLTVQERAQGEDESLPTPQAAQGNASRNNHAKIPLNTMRQMMENWEKDCARMHPRLRRQKTMMNKIAQQRRPPRIAKKKKLNARRRKTDQNIHPPDSSVWHLGKQHHRAKIKRTIIPHRLKMETVAQTRRADLTSYPLYRKVKKYHPQ